MRTSPLVQGKKKFWVCQLIPELWNLFNEKKKKKIKKKTKLEAGRGIKQENVYTILGLLCIYSRKAVSILYHLPFAAVVVV